MTSLSKSLTILIATFAILSIVTAPARALQTFNWAGYTWTISPYAIGSGIVSGNASNVWIDASGYLHLDLSKIGTTWYGAEVATTNNFGFGHFYYVLNAPVTSMEAQDVIAGFTYGPQNGVGKDGTNEIDVEFSKWNNASWWPIGDNLDFAIYPNSALWKGKLRHVEDDIAYTGTNTCTVRIDWSSTSVTESVWNGVVSTTASPSTAVNTWTYNGTTTTIPQLASPFLLNIWSYGVAPTQPVDAVIQSFAYYP